jgi:hypothetical protein
VWADPSPAEQALKVSNNFLFFNSEGFVAGDFRPSKLKGDVELKPVKGEQKIKAKTEVLLKTYYYFVSSCCNRSKFIMRSSCGVGMPERKQAYWSEILLDDGLTPLCEKFPPDIDLVVTAKMKKGTSLAQTPFPTKAIIKNAVDDTCQAMQDHHEFLRLLTPKPRKDNPQFHTINMRKFPELFANMVVIVMFCTGGTKQGSLDEKLQALQAGIATAGKCHLYFEEIIKFL